jgi:cyclic pyranopterin phosphate synthase
MNPLTDKLKRPLHDLRISVIDRCNFRCNYCMPDDQTHTFLKEKEWLTFDQIERMVKIFLDLGVKKVRLTGGEPLLRPNLTELVKRLSSDPQIEDLALTTNGSLLKKYAVDLKQAGLNRLTVSLDTLDSRVFKQMGGRGALKDVLDGIQAAEEAGFASLKINVVVQKGVNDHQIVDIIRYFKNTKHVVRFIEYMDVGTCNHWDMKYVVPTKELIERIRPHFSLEEVNSNYFGEVANRFKFSDGKGEIGFISSISKSFCQSCTRARLSTDGKIYTCLFAENGFDVGSLLREGKSDQEILNFVQDIWKNRDDRYSEIRSSMSASQSLHKVEMFQIGG